LPQAPSYAQIFQSFKFGVPDFQAGQRFAKQIAPVDYAAVAKLLPPPAPAQPVLAATPAVPAAAGAAATASTTPATADPFDLEHLHVEVKSLVASRDLVTEDYGEVLIGSDKPDMGVVFDGKPLTRSLPFTLKVPAGKYVIRSVEAGKTLLEREVEVKPGASVRLMLQ